MAEKLNALALGYAGAIISAVGMGVLGILGNIGVLTNIVESMMRWHLFFSLSVIGIITGMIEAAVFNFILLYALAWLYNKFV